MEINIDYYHRLAETESDPQKLKVEMLKLLQTTVDILLAAKRSEIETAKSGRVEQGVMAHAFMEECHKKFIKKAKENNRSLQPWKNEPRNYLRDRLEEEKEELFDAMLNGDIKGTMDECLDIANFAWFIYENTKARIETGP